DLAGQEGRLGAHLVDPELVVHAQGGELLVHLAHPCGQLLVISPWADELLLLGRHEGVDHAGGVVLGSCRVTRCRLVHVAVCPSGRRWEEHTSELQSRFDLVCRLLLSSPRPCASLFSYTTLFRSRW